MAVRFISTGPQNWENTKYGIPILQEKARADGAIGAASATASGQRGAAREAAFGTAEAGRYGALGGLATARANDNANRYGAYATAEGNRQTAMANEAGSRLSAYGVAEAARQTALGNLGSSALGAYGSAANQALQAWAQNQQAYNNALASMQTSSQNAMSGLGQSRNSALGQLGASYTGAGVGLGGASAASDLSGSLGTSFNASSPSGTVASGSVSGGGGGGGAAIPGLASQTFAGLGQVGQGLMAGDIRDSLAANANRGLDDLNAQHYSSRLMPAQMQGQTFADLLTMGDQYVAPTMQGMSEFYANANFNRPDFAAGMNQFYDSMAAVQPDDSDILDILRTPTANTSAPTWMAPPAPAPMTSQTPRPRGQTMMPGMASVRPTATPRSRVSPQEQQELVRSRTGMNYMPGTKTLDDWYRRLTASR